MSFIFLVLFFSLILLVRPSESFLLGTPKHEHWLQRASKNEQTFLLFSSRSGLSANGEPYDDVMLDKLLEVALAASRKAVAIIAKNAQGAKVQETKSTSRDLLTLIDPMCETAIRETVMAMFPDHLFLGEEGVEPGVENAKAALEEKLQYGGWLWIVDPIDGMSICCLVCVNWL